MCGFVHRPRPRLAPLRRPGGKKPLKLRHTTSSVPPAKSSRTLLLLKPASGVHLCSQSSVQQSACLAARMENESISRAPFTEICCPDQKLLWPELAPAARKLLLAPHCRGISRSLTECSALAEFDPSSTVLLSCKQQRSQYIELRKDRRPGGTYRTRKCARTETCSTLSLLVIQFVFLLLLLLGIAP